MSLLAMRSLEK
ncbi:hypothetical protein LINPERHAP2_LOCUS7077 [Linum perenne]